MGSGKAAEMIFMAARYMSQSISAAEWVPRNLANVYIKLVKHVKHSTNKLRIVNVDRRKSGNKFNFSPQ